ncbi:MAG: M20/M25/M40 family metallo-hydrolase [Bdellovibrio sp.]|nr:M20/M25/M40 family metallo-hydrolase [Bdellovibrio sp.]
MMFFSLLISLLFSTAVGSQEIPLDIRERSLQEVVPAFNPQNSLAANSEQRMPLILEYSWNSELLKQGEKAVKAVHQAFARSGELMEFEAWPAGADSIQRVWVVARWRPKGKAAWRWIDLSLSDEMEKQSIVLPTVQTKEHLIFDDVMAPHRGLYDKPLFGDCVFTQGKGSVVLKAWPEPELRMALRSWLNQHKAVCRSFPRPPVLNGRPKVFHAESDGMTVRWRSLPGRTHTDAVWETEAIKAFQEFPRHLDKDYKLDVQVVAGEVQSHEFGRTWPLFKRKNSAQPNNQIGDLVEYLEARYHALGITTERQVFFWRGIQQYNLIAKIAGTDAQAAPVVIADHMDTAFEEDTFRQTGERVATHGADDNATAVAGLLSIAKTLHKTKIRRPVWLLHLTGEEFPADDLGARHFISELLRRKQKVQAVMVMDMIGYPGKDNNKGFFQISVGESPQSQALGQLAFKTALLDNHKILTPLLRARFSPKTYLHQTDALIFSDLGFPVILFNEWLNEKENWDRPYYHQHDDTSDTLDFDYAVSILKVVIQTVIQISL